MNDVGVEVERLVDGLLPLAADVYEACGCDFAAALEQLSGRVFSAWSDRLTVEVAGVVACLALLVLDARGAYRSSAGGVSYVVGGSG